MALSISCCRVGVLCMILYVLANTSASGCWRLGGADTADTLDPLPNWANEVFQRDIIGYLKWDGWHRLERSRRDILFSNGRPDDTGGYDGWYGPATSGEKVRLLAWVSKDISRYRRFDSLTIATEALIWVKFNDSLRRERWALLLLDGSSICCDRYEEWKLSAVTRVRMELRGSKVVGIPDTVHDRVHWWPIRTFDHPPIPRDVVDFMNAVLPPDERGDDAALLFGLPSYDDAERIVIRERTWRGIVGKPPRSLFVE